MKKIVLTGGGSAGHVTPHLALLPHLLKEGYEVHYIGTQDGIEHGMVGNLPGVTYHVVKSGKLRRYFDWKNFTDPFRVIAGAFQSAHLMRRLKPDVCFSKGGFVSVPVVVGAWLHGVPVLCHESDLTPGLANGALLAIILGGAWSLVWPGVPLGAFAIIGAAAFLAATTLLSAAGTRVALTGLGLAAVDGKNVRVTIASTVANATAGKFRLRLNYTTDGRITEVNPN